MSAAAPSLAGVGSLSATVTPVARRGRPPSTGTETPAAAERDAGVEHRLAELRMAERDVEISAARERVAAIGRKGYNSSSEPRRARQTPSGWEPPAKVDWDEPLERLKKHLAALYPEEPKQYPEEPKQEKRYVPHARSVDYADRRRQR
jgi:hypothetical protein